MSQLQLTELSKISYCMPAAIARCHIRDGFTVQWYFVRFIPNGDHRNRSLTDTDCDGQCQWITQSSLIQAGSQGSVKQYSDNIKKIIQNDPQK